MCGIVALHGLQEESWIELMNAGLRHRGPDSHGVFRDRNTRLALAMQRLAIIDTSGGAQPMSTTDGRHTIVYNGEVYNAPELRRELEAAGERFSTDHSDTEVVLRLLIRQGQDALSRLNGMFALVFYDREAGTLLFARDRFGIKPLYYTEVAGRLAIASEMKAFLYLPYISRSLNVQSLHHYMSLMYLPDESAIFTGVRRVAPGTAITYHLDTRTLTVSRWWRLSWGHGPSFSRDEWCERLRQAFCEAVRRWTLADVPVACSLSGGLDSSAIVGALATSGMRPKTYALGFTGNGEEDWNELPRARLVARHWGTDHHEIILNPERLLDDLVQMTWHLDEPYGGGLPSWSVFQMMSKDVKVGLTGTGGDELFGNYGKWRPLEGRIFGRLFQRPVTADRFSSQFFQRFYYATEEEKKKQILLTSSGIQSTAELLFQRFNDAPSGNERDRIAETDITTQLSEEFLLMTDRFSMAHSLEARTPFLDAEFSTLALSVPASLRTHPRDLKGLLRQTVSPLLPREAQNLPKRGFVIPLALWLRGCLRGLTERLLAPERLKRQGLYRPEFYALYVQPHLEGRADHTQKVWAALMFQLWHLVFIENSGPPDFTLADLTA
jgi:asparagine synthase (glutamine-hydrolysing)